MIFVDTNVFLRFFLADVHEQHQEALSLFRQAAVGKQHLCTSVLVFFELYWVLTSFYGKSKNEVSKILEDIFLLPFIEIENIEVLEEALLLFKERSVELEDCYNVAYAKQKKTDFFTFDKKLQTLAKNLF